MGGCGVFTPRGRHSACDRGASDCGICVRAGDQPARRGGRFHHPQETDRDHFVDLLRPGDRRCSWLSPGQGLRPGDDADGQHEPDRRILSAAHQLVHAPIDSLHLHLVLAANERRFPVRDPLRRVFPGTQGKSPAGDRLERPHRRANCRPCRDASDRLATGRAAVRAA